MPWRVQILRAAMLRHSVKGRVRDGAASVPFPCLQLNNLPLQLGPYSTEFTSIFESIRVDLQALRMNAELKARTSAL